MSDGSYKNQYNNEHNSSGADVNYSYPKKNKNKK